MGYTGNGLGWVFEVGTGATVASVTSTGFNVNNVKSFASTDLTLTGQSGNINMVCGSTTVGAFTNTGAVGLAVDNIRNLTATNLTLNANGSGTLYIQCSGTTAYTMSPTKFIFQGATSQALYCNVLTGTGSGGTITFPISTTLYTQIVNVNASGWTQNPSSWNSYGYNLIGGGTLGYNSTALALVADTNYTGIISLAPNVAWRAMWIWAASISIGYYGVQCAYSNSSGWVNISDGRKKKNIKDLKTDKSLQKILTCKPKTYNLINTDPLAPPEQPLIGLIAQDQMTSNPHCVSPFKDRGDDTEYYGIQYHDYTIHLIGAVQEQHKMILAQQAQIDFLTLKMNQLLEKIK
jgi:hypothetical protein